MIGMWGSRGAGKTTYLAALYFDVMQKKQTEDKRWVMRGNTDVARELIAEAYERFVGQRFPPPTNPANAIEPLAFTITTPIAGRPAAPAAATAWLRIVGAVRDAVAQLSEGSVGDLTEIELSLFDPSGEFFLEPHRLTSGVDPQASACGQMLANSSGLLCMIDPDREDGQHYFPIIYRNFVQLSKLMNGPGGGPLEIPVAICVTKSDKYPEAFDHPEEFLTERMGSTASFALADACPNRAYFAISAIGHDNLITDEQGIPRPKGEPKPVNVLQPLEWLTSVMR